MKNMNDIIQRQKTFIDRMKKAARVFVDSFDKTGVLTVLIAGSVARGDFCTEDLGGMIDLIVMVCDEKSFDKNKIFGQNEEPDIPYHCVSREINGEKIRFQIDIRKFVSAEVFENLEEARRYSILESEILFDNENCYKNELERINQVKRQNLKDWFNRTMGFINDLLSNYKKQKFYRRDCPIQLHQNLNIAIQKAVQCIYYINGEYRPAEERDFFYSLHLKKIPENYEELLVKLFKQDMSSFDDYENRENLFRENFLNYLNKFKGCL